jgi:chorismate synthase
MNSFGTKFRISIFGESHGAVIGIVMDGVPHGIMLSESDFAESLARRKSGAKGTTGRTESDVPHIVSGVYNGYTTGAPLTVIFNNENCNSQDYAEMNIRPRPSHADFAAMRKFGGFNDLRGGGHFSGRMTLGIVAAGVVARKMLGNTIEVDADIVEIGGSADSSAFDTIIASAMADGDSVGGVIECVVSGLPAGLGEPFFDSLESLISHIIFAIPGIKGIEFGNGFSGAKLRGSENNDMIIAPDGKTATNNSGGINGGITNGNPMTFRVAVRPTASISRPQSSINLQTGEVETFSIHGRHDACIALRMPVIVESAVAIALAQFI